MRSWISEVRIGIVAGLTAAGVFWGASQIQVIVDRNLAPAWRDTRPASWRPPLSDPVAAARAAIARGEGIFVAVTLGDSLSFPGVPPALQRSAEADPVRVYSPRSTGLRRSP